LERNPDEFYFGMIRAQTKGGRHIKDRDEPDDKTRKRQKTADELLITMRKQTEGN
jgi:hypothetical protein